MLKIVNIITYFRSLFDFHVAATLALRLWALLAGSITVLLVPIYLTKTEQGYYFTFAGVLALQIFFELGLNYVLVQFTASQMPKLHFKNDGMLAGDITTLQKIRALVKTLFKVYLVLSFLFCGLIGAGGAYFFSSSGFLPLAKWLPSWLLMTGFTAGNLFFGPFLAIAEGTGRVGQIARLRMVQSIVGYICAWICITRGYGLLAMPCIAGANFFGSVIWWYLNDNYISYFHRSSHIPLTESVLKWRQDIFPFQWRMAISWISGYLIFQMFTPVIFKHYGAIEAGAVGLTLSVFGAITTLSMSWLNAKAPEITSYLKSANPDTARLLFRRQFTVSFSVNFLLVAGVVLSVALMKMQKFSAAERFPALAVLIWMAIAAVANQVVFALAVFMRAHGEEPLMIPSVVTGLGTLSILTLSGGNSIQLIMMLYAGVQTLVCLPWVGKLFLSRYWYKTFQPQL